MRTSIAFRVAAGLALATGLTAGGVTAAFATTEAECLELPLLQQAACLEDATDSVPDVPADPPPLPDPLPGDEPPVTSEPPTTTEPPAADDGATNPPPASGGGNNDGGDTGTGSGETGGNNVGGGNSGGTTTNPSTPAAPPSQQPAPAPGGSGSNGSTSTGSTSGGTAAASSGSSSSSSSASDTVVTAAPAGAAVAPSGPALTQAQSKAAGAAIEEVRSTLPTTVEPNTRLLAGSTTSQSSLMPSPNDSGLLALIIAMGALSAGCAIAAGVMRRRSRPRHVA